VENVVLPKTENPILGLLGSPEHSTEILLGADRRPSVNHRPRLAFPAVAEKLVAPTHASCAPRLNVCAVMVRCPPKSNAGRGWKLVIEPRRYVMNNRELELQLERLEELLDEVLQLIDDPDISDSDLREQIRAVVEETDDVE
jgi:hypothetical protein